MMRQLVLVLLLCAGPGATSAVTLYRWTDASGEIRYGHQPPPGVDARPAEEDRRELYSQAVAVDCRQLADRHLHLIDRELDRIKALPAGLGPEFQFTPAARQELILDLLAHRAALISGRPASEFRAPGSAEIERMRDHYEKDLRKLREAVKDEEEKGVHRRHRRAPMPYPAGYGAFPVLGPPPRR